MTDFSGKLVIDLGAIASNWRAVQARLGAGVQAGAVIKADAYGLGATRVVPALYSAGCRTFFVANLNEAQLVRELLGPSARIIVLSGCAPGEEPRFVGLDVEPVLISLEMAERWLEVVGARECGSVLKVNSGMGRLGLEPEELTRLLSRADFLDAGCTTLMSHLACADDASHPLNTVQLDRFTAMFAEFKRRVPAATASLANSSGVFLSPEYHFDLVRPGFALYGGNPVEGRANPMKSVVSIELPVLQVRHLGVGEAIGYGATFVTSRKSVVLTVAGGYADGVFRSAAERAYVRVGDYRLPVVGRVSMDSIVVDATDLPGGACPRVGETVMLLGSELSVEELAQNMGTIGYEVLTSLGRRYRRTYVQGDADE